MIDEQFISSRCICYVCSAATPLKRSRDAGLLQWKTDTTNILIHPDFHNQNHLGAPTKIQHDKTK